jgi:Leucine-rich repeat (LRR) protein
MRLWTLLTIFIANSIYGQSKFDSKLECSNINRDYLLATKKSIYKIVVVNNLKELSALKNKGSIKAIKFELPYPEYEIKTAFTEILKFKNLEYLETYGNIIIPEEIDKLTNLKFLSMTIHSNAIPISIGKLQKLEILRFNNCDYLEELPESLYELVNLKELRLHGLIRIDTISQKIGKLINLEKLSLNSRVVLPDEVLNLKHLKYLVCEKAQPVIFKIKTLETLYTKASESSELTGIKNLSEIKELYLDTPDFDEELKELKTLRHLEITSFEKDFIDLSSLTNLEVLIMWSCDEIKELPNFIYNLKKLKYLAVNSCKEFQYISGKINQIKNLEYLELKYNNKLKKYPKFRNMIKINIKKYGEI